MSVFKPRKMSVFKRTIYHEKIFVFRRKIYHGKMSVLKRKIYHRIRGKNTVFKRPFYHGKTDFSFSEFIAVSKVKIPFFYFFFSFPRQIVRFGYGHFPIKSIFLVFRPKKFTSHENCLPIGTVFIFQKL